MKFFLFGVISLFLSNFVLAMPVPSVEDSDFDLGKKVQDQCTSWFEHQEFKKLDVFLSNNDNDVNKDLNGSSIIGFCFGAKIKNPKTLLSWKKQNSKSIYPTMFKHFNLTDEFFKIRGDKYINETPKENLIQAFNLLENGAKEMDEDKKLGTSPYWYFIRIKIAFYQQDKSNFFNNIREGTKQYPNFRQLYTQAVSNMTPQWGFSYKNINDFALTGMQISDLKEEIYTYSYLHIVTPCCSNKIISAGYFDKSIYKKGMTSILSKYSTQKNYNKFAQASCLLGDIASTKELMNEKMTIHVKSVWFPNVYEYCKQLIQ